MMRAEKKSTRPDITSVAALLMVFKFDLRSFTCKNKAVYFLVYNVNKEGRVGV